MAGGQSTSYIDSLNKLLLETHDITDRIEIYTLLSKQYHVIDLVKAKECANQAIKLSENSDFEDFLGDSYRSLGDIAVKEDSLDLAQSYFQIALEHFERQEEYRKLAFAITVLGNIEFVRDRYSEAMYYYLDAINIAKEHEVENILPILYLNIGAIHSESDNNTDAIENFSLALQGFQKLRDSMNIAQAYHNLGAIYQKMNDFDHARIYLDNAKKIYLDFGNNDGTAGCLYNLAIIEHKKGNNKSAIELIYTALDYMQSKHIHYTAPASTKFAIYYVKLGKFYLTIEDIPNAYKYYVKGYKIALLNRQISQIALASEGISEIWKQRGNIDSSFYYFQIYNAYFDSLTNEKNIRKLAMLDAQFNYEQRLIEKEQNRIREEERERINYLILSFIITGLVLVIILMVLLLKLWRTKAKRAALEHEALRNELEIRNKELTTHVMYQLKKNEFILSISQKLQSGLFKLKPENRGLIEEIIRDLEHDSDVNTWDEFEVRFHRVHSDFNKKLLGKFPDLSANELRLCAFLRLNMNTKEIAAITYQSTNSIDTARSRLRQKLGLEKNDNLIGFLNQY